MFKITYKFMKHSGGTKFYETAMLENTSAEKAIVIFRWGKIDLATGGRGETQITNFEKSNSAKAESLFHEKINEKRKSKNGGQYQDFFLGQGLSREVGNGDKFFNSPNDFTDAFAGHYKSETVEEIVNFLEVDSDAWVATPGAKNKVSPDYNDQIDRGEEWGSF